MSHSIEDIKNISDPKKVKKILLENNIQMKREGKGGHGIWGNQYGSFPLEEHGELSKPMRHAIYKQVKALLILAGGLVIAIWLWNSCPGWLYDLIFA